MRVEDVYDSPEERRRLARLLGRYYLQVLHAWQQLVHSVFPQLSPDDFRLDDPATRRQLDLAAEQVALIDAATRDQLRDVLREGQKRGYADQQIADGVPADGYGGIKGLYLDTWRGRAETIARTEIATASVAASLSRYAATGLVTHVRLHEHEDTDAFCAERNGTVVPISAQPGLAHPNCRLGIEPIVNEAA